MSKKESKYNSKEKLLKLKVPLLISPNTQKKYNNIIKLNIEPKRIYQETEYNLSKNKIKQKINFGDLNTNSKLHLKKNMTQNTSALNNIQFNIGKSSQNILNSKNSAENLKKNSGSAYELLNNISTNHFNTKKNSKNIIKLNNINSLGFIYTSPNEKNNEPITPHPIGLNSKIIFLKNEKQIKSNENIIDEEEKKEDINCVLRNSYTNVKIYPTTFLNNKIIFQNNNNENKSNKSDNSNSISNMKHNNSKIKKEKIIIDTENQNNKKNENSLNFQSMEELHFFFVKTLQTGKIIEKDLDKSNN